MNTRLFRTGKHIALLLLAGLGLVACTEDSPITSPRQTEEVVVADTGAFAKGADVSWLTQMESEGNTFANQQGETKECMRLLKEDCNVDAIRLRVWVNPEEGWCNPEDMLIKALRAKALGLRVMVDFHFSDSWADPGSQTTPTAWANYDLEQLKTAVADHVNRTLNLLKAYDITPEWVQIGNETRGGMLWPLGELNSSNDNYAQLNNAGYDAVKQVFPKAQVIVHIDKGEQLGLYTYAFDYLKAHGGKYDVIGMSLYPDTGKSASFVDACVSNISTLYTRYGKEVMICEVGMDYDQPEECKQFITSLMAQGKATGHLLGIFYWEPQAPAGYNGGYSKGCFQNGRPTIALDAFAE